MPACGPQSRVLALVVLSRYFSREHGPQAFDLDTKEHLQCSTCIHFAAKLYSTSGSTSARVMFAYSLVPPLSCFLRLLPASCELLLLLLSSPCPFYVQSSDPNRRAVTRPTTYFPRRCLFFPPSSCRLFFSCRPNDELCVAV